MDMILEPIRQQMPQTVSSFLKALKLLVLCSESLRLRCCVDASCGNSGYRVNEAFSVCSRLIPVYGLSGLDHSTLLPLSANLTNFQVETAASLNDGTFRAVLVGLCRAVLLLHLCIWFQCEADLEHAPYIRHPYNRIFKT
jgi:hypothetical protein